MSTVATNTLKNVAGTKTAPVADIVDGYAKAWVRFNATTGTPVIGASFNVTSITDNGVGDFTINLTLALTDANYSAVGSAGDNAAAQHLMSVGYTTAPSSSALRVATTNPATGATVDCINNSVVLFR